MKKLQTLIKKEILDILRDRKTLIIMVVMPILLYPAIIIGMVLVLSMFAQSQEAKEYTIAYDSRYATFVQQLEEVYENKKEEINTDMTFLAVDSAEKEFAQDMFDVWMNVAEDEKGIHVTAEYTSTDQDSGYAESVLGDLCDIYREELLAEELIAEGLTEDFLHPVTYEANDSVSVSESAGMSMGGSIGMMLIVTIMLGAFYPAIDATTGEKERGTLETLLTLPVTNFQMIMSKYVAVSLFACVTAILSLLSLGASVIFLISSLSAEVSEEFVAIDMATMIGWLPILLLVMITAALLITAFSMCFCVFAKSFKEANNYITPVMLVVMFASMVGMVPSIQLDFKTALIPIVNVSLLMKQVMAQQLDLALAGITIAINFCYSVLVIWILAKMYDSENVLFCDGFQSFRLFEKRSEMKKGTIPNIGDVLLSIVILLLFVFYIGTAVSARSVFAGTIVQQLLILAVPLVVVWYMKSDVKRLFSIKAPSVKNVFGGLVLYIGVYALMMIVSVIFVQLFPESAQNVEQTFGELLNQPFGLIVLVVAVMPAIGEEIFFRGFTYGSLQHKYGAVWGIIISSLIFGAFHMSLVKFIPTAMLGACFAYIAYKSGSIVIGMCLHFINNLISLIAMEYPEQMGKVLPILMKSEVTTMDIVIMVIVGVVGVAAGAMLLRDKAVKEAA